MSYNNKKSYCTIIYKNNQYYIDKKIIFRIRQY